MDLTVDVGDYKLNVRAAVIIIHRNKILVHKNVNSDHYALIGGRVKVGEDSANTVKREIREELGKEIKLIGYVSTVENFFELEGLKYHEVLFIHQGEFRNEEDKKIECTLQNVEGKDYLQYEWLEIDKIEEYTLVPKVIKEILKQNKIISEENNKLNLNYNLLLENLIKKYNNNEIINLINNLKENSLENINYYIHKNQEEINNKKIEKNKIDIDIENINNNLENLINLEEEKIKLQKELKQLENKNNSFNIAKEVLQIAYEKMKNNVTPKFTKNLSQTINKISNGKYNKVTINDEEGLMVELENGEYITADRLSIGTIDQLYLSLRLSMAEEISEEKMPVILDEAFAYFDDYRLENALKFLVEELEENQIILFTCTKREEEILNRLNIKYNLIEL